MKKHDRLRTSKNGIRLDAKTICWIILLLGAVLKLVYALSVPYSISPHDLGRVSDWVTPQRGHIGYIQYICQYGKLPEMSLTNPGAVYHPPFFHLIAALVCKIFFTATGDIVYTLEVIQVVNTLFACLATVYVYRILEHLSVADTPKIIVTVFFAFCPIFYILGTSINNDCLMTLLSIAAIDYTVIWAREQRMSTIVKIALCIGLAMFTKTSAATLAPAIAAVFLWTLWKKRAEWKKLLGQFAVFGVICVPLGLGWSVWNVLHGMPAHYILRLPDSADQFVGKYSLWQRYGFPSREQIGAYRVDWTHPEQYCNLWGQTILTMLFDEGILKIETALEIRMARLLWWTGAASCLLALWDTAAIAFDRTISVVHRIFFPVGYLVMMAGFVSFSYQYPHICTMNFRYITASLAFLFGAYALRRSHHGGKGIFMGVFVSLFAVSSAGLFLLCA